MYNEYFGLGDSPFSIAPNPQYLYMSERHREALAHLLYGIRSDGGFVLITGEVGTGKTTVCRCLLEQIPDDVDTAFILNPKVTAHELLATICDDLGIEYSRDATIKGFVDKLNTFLLASHHSGRRTVLIIDEAQNLSVDVLEQIRLLTNLETNQRKLLQIILLGQPELLTLLSRPEMRQLSQRITARFHLDALNREEVSEYIEHRLSIAGAQREIFPPAAIKQVFKLSQGIPRLVNMLCDRSLLGTYVEGRGRPSSRIVKKAAKEVLGATRPSGPPWPVAVSLAAVLVIVTGMTLIYYAPEKPAEYIAAETSQKTAARPADDNALPAAEPRESILTSTTTGPAAGPDTGPEATALDQITGHALRERALADLFAVWDTQPSGNEADPCAFSSSVALECMNRLGSLRDVEHLNRPALIRLYLDEQDHWFTLTGLQQEDVQITAGEREFTISRRELLSKWDGEYTLLWRTPPHYTHPVKRGDRGVVVDWLAARFDVTNDNETRAEGGYEFDRALEERVKRFQISVGLNPDGIVGAQTLIHMNNQEGIDVPLLIPGHRGH